MRACLLICFAINVGGPALDVVAMIAFRHSMLIGVVLFIVGNASRTKRFLGREMGLPRCVGGLDVK
jgi:hypothetical protein